MKKTIITIFAIVVVIVLLFTLVLIFSHREAIAPTVVNIPNSAMGGN